jgi:hypothetical protein
MLLSQILEDIKSRYLGRREMRHVGGAGMRFASYQGGVEEVEDGAGLVVEEYWPLVVVRPAKVIKLIRLDEALRGLTLRLANWARRGRGSHPVAKLPALSEGVADVKP